MISLVEQPRFASVLEDEVAIPGTFVLVVAIEKLSPRSSADSCTDLHHDARVAPVSFVVLIVQLHPLLVHLGEHLQSAIHVERDSKLGVERLQLQPLGPGP